MSQAMAVRNTQVLLVVGDQRLGAWAPGPLYAATFIVRKRIVKDGSLTEIGTCVRQELDYDHEHQITAVMIVGLFDELTHRTRHEGEPIYLRISPEPPISEV